MSFKTVSAILRGRWLLDKHWAEAQMPLIVSALKGNGSMAVMFDGEEKKDEDTEPKLVVLSHKAGSVYSVSAYSNIANLPEGSIAMVNIVGPVTKYGDLCAWGSVDHTATLNRLGKAANVKGIILNIDSPGGEAAGTAMLADTIKEVSKSKPIVAVIDDGIAASAAMWIASAATEIYTTQKTDMVGSIGVYTTIADWYGYFAKAGLDVKDIYAPQSTDKNLDYREALKGNDALVQEDLKVLAQEFIDTVKTNRGNKLAGTGWETGKMFYSKEATKMGLIDGQKTFSQVVRRMDTMIKQREQSNSNNMAFEKTLKSANATEFEVVDGGFLLDEAHLNSIEAKLSENETAIFNLTTAVSEVNGNLAISKQETADALSGQQALANEITNLKEQIATLKAGAAKPAAATLQNQDDLGADNKEQVSETTREAQELYEQRYGKKKMIN